MRNFIILFEEKEGSTALISLMENFENVSTIQLAEENATEPFDAHASGPISRKDLRRCLKMIYGGGQVDFDELNEIYRKTANASIAKFDGAGSVGFKMRFVAQQKNLLRNVPISLFRNACRRTLRILFERTMFKVFRQYEVVVLISVRQDIFRWALSKYHGDGTGRDGHLQFRLASGQIRRSDIQRIYVDGDDLADIIEGCRRAHRRKKQLIEALKKDGVDAYPVFYEDFLRDKRGYFRRLFGFLEIQASDLEIDSALEKGSRFEKVHSEDIAQFVENHEEIQARFGGEFVRWQ